MEQLSTDRTAVFFVFCFFLDFLGLVVISPILVLNCMIFIILFFIIMLYLWQHYLADYFYIMVGYHFFTLMLYIVEF